MVFVWLFWGSGLWRLCDCHILPDINPRNSYEDERRHPALQKVFSDLHIHAVDIHACTHLTCLSYMLYKKNKYYIKHNLLKEIITKPHEVQIRTNPDLKWNVRPEKTNINLWFPVRSCLKIYLRARYGDICVYY